MRNYYSFSLVLSLMLLVIQQGCSPDTKLFEDLSSVKYYGGYANQNATKVLMIDDKKYILGTSSSFSLNRTEDIFFVVTDRIGNELFSKVYGNDKTNEKAVDFVSLNDGFVILFNYENTSSSSGHAIMKIDFLGNAKYERKFSLNNKVATSLLKINEDEFIITGYYRDSSQKKNFFVSNFDSNGLEKWTLNGNEGFSGDNEAIKSHLLLDNKILVFGNSDINQNILVFVIDNEKGTVINSKFFGGTGTDIFYDYANVKNTYYVVGSSTSNFVSQTIKTNKDFLLFNFEANGTEIGEGNNVVTFGGPEDDIAKSIIIDNNGDLLLAGETQSFRNNATDFDQILIKTNKYSVVYQDWISNPRLYGSDGVDIATQIVYDEKSIFILGDVNFSLTNDITLISLIKLNIQGKIIF